MVLHITNGDSTQDLIERSGLGGDVLPWQDVLHEGPVPAALGPAELRRVRVTFLSRSGWAPAVHVEADLGRRDRALAELAVGAEVVLWFEHDLYDQLQLLQVLDALRGHDAPDGAVSLICIGAFPGRPRFRGLGELEPADVRTLWPTRAAVRSEQFRLAQSAWAAFRSPHPRAVENVRAAGTDVLPFLDAALGRHLQEFPWTRDGLSRTERALLEPLRDGPLTPVELFEAQADGEEAPFLGDTIVWSRLVRLGGGAEPLLRVADGGAPGLAGAAFDVDRPLALTEAGRHVLDGLEDRVALQGADRWLGGVHLHGRDVWRWDADAGRLAAPLGSV